MSEKLTDLKLYNVAELAKLLEVTTRTVHTYIKDGRLKGVKIGGQWKFTEENIRKFISGDKN